MKNAIIYFFLVLLLAACKTSQKDATQKETSSVENSNSHLAYEVLIKEPGFLRWKEKQPQISAYKVDFLKEKNATYISNFNKRVNNSEYSNKLYPSKINYNKNQDYSKEVHYNLYNYFIYFQEKYKQHL